MTLKKRLAQNEKRLAQTQRRQDFAVGDEILPAVQVLCTSTLKAAKEERRDEFEFGTNRLLQIRRQLARFGRELEAYQNQRLRVEATQEESLEEAKDIARRVVTLCAEFTRLMAEGRTEDAQVLVPYLREIKTSCSEINLPEL